MVQAVRGRRRYRIAETPSALPFGRPERPRTAIVALIAVVVVAAVIGALIGSLTGGGSSHAGGGPSHAGARSTPKTGSTPTAASSGRAPSAALDSELGRVLRVLASARTAGWARQAGARGAAEQAAAIATIAAAYRTAAGRVDTIRGSPRGLQTVLDKLAGSYGSLAAAAEARDLPAYRRQASRVDSEEQRLSSLAGSL